MELPIRYKKTEYPEITEPRRADRAKVWLISWKEALKVAPQLKKFWLEPGNTIDNPPEEFENTYDVKEIFRKMTKLLRERESDLRRGDMVYLEPELGYRNDGIYIYDGKTIRTLTGEVIDYGHIPSEFEVITEFPIHYWEGRNHHNDLVPFDVRKNFGLLKLKDIDALNADIFRPYFYFENDDDEGYYIIAEYYPGEAERPKGYAGQWKPPPSHDAVYRAFLRQLNNARFFYPEAHESEEFYPEDFDIDPNNILYLDLDENDFQELPENSDKG